MFTGFKLQPCCIDHCRDWRETAKGALPASNHSPACLNYKEETFFLVRPEDKKGYGCIVATQEDAKALADDNIHLIATINLTRDQFDRLAEFEGF
jgi:hypothetical protein